MPRCSFRERNSLLFGPFIRGEKNLVEVWILYDFFILHTEIEVLISENKRISY